MVNKVVVWHHVLGPYWYLYVLLFGGRLLNKQNFDNIKMRGRNVKINIFYFFLLILILTFATYWLLVYRVTVTPYHIYTPHSVGLPMKRDQPFVEAPSCTTPDIHKRQVSGHTKLIKVAFSLTCTQTEVSATNWCKIQILYWQLRR